MKLLYVQWEDASSRSSWSSLETVEDWNKNGRFMVETLGWLVKDTDKVIIIAGSHNPESEYSDEVYGDLIRIPKTWIRKRKVIKL